MRPIQPQYRFYLMATENDYYVLSSGVVATSTNPVEVSAPRNWQNTQLSWSRNTKYHGVFLALSTPYQWVRDGATILRHLYYTQGIEGKCILRIDMRNPNGSYATLFSGAIDFSQAEDSEVFFSANAVSDDLFSRLKASEGIMYQIPMEEVDSTVVNMNGMPLQDTLSFVTIAQNTLDGFQAGMRESQVNTYAYHEAVYEVGAHRNTGAGGMDFHNFPFDTGEAANWLYEADRTLSIVVRYKGTFIYSKFFSGSPDPYLAIRAYVTPAGSASPTAYDVFIDGTSCGSGTRTVDVDAVSDPITLNAGERLYVLWMMHVPGPSGSTSYSVGYTDASLLLDLQYKVGDTKTRAYRQYQVWQKLIALATEGEYSGTSGFLESTDAVMDNRPHDTVLTSGDALRNILVDVLGAPTSPKIKTSINEFFQHAQSLYPVGLGIIANELIIERLAYFYDADTEIADLGEVSDLEISPATDWFANDVKAGYPKVDTDNLNGRNEYNTTTQWKVPITRIHGKTLDLVSPYSAGIYGIEYTRANLMGKTASGQLDEHGKLTTDGSTDNDTFILSTEADEQVDGSYNLQRLAIGASSPAGNAAGILFPEHAYNLDVTPKRNFNRNGVRIHVGTHLIEAGEISFQTADKNQNLISTFPGSTEVDEDANHALGPSNPRVVLPLLFKFRKPAPSNLKQLLGANPYGYFRFRGRIGKKNVQLKGYLIESGLVPATKAVQEWTLIAHPDCDLSALHG